MSPPQENADGLKTIGSLRYSLRAEPGYALLVYEGAPATITAADVWQRDIDAFLRACHLTRVLWDSRNADPLPPPVRAHTWAWLTRAEVVKVSAIVVRSELLRISGNMSSVGGQLRLRSFHELGEAVEWLLRQRP
ncbi:MAG: hypothetical protein MUF34_14405 [Polyangiaceae bacterium]|nr:hypothetical protein [Polyangiaceae bacterium]